MAKYVERGGVVLFETPGGQGEFTASAEAMAESVFGQAPQSINSSRIVTGEGLPKGQRLARIGYRPFAVQQFGIGETAPRLLGIAPDGQIATRAVQPGGSQPGAPGSAVLGGARLPAGQRPRADGEHRGACAAAFESRVAGPGGAAG